MCENEKNEYENKIEDSKCTDDLFKCYRSFKNFKNSTSMFYLNEQANDPRAQAELFSNCFASIFIELKILPRTTHLRKILDFDLSQE